MSRQIDLSKELSDVDREYLLSRDRYDEVAFNAVATGTKLPDDVREQIREKGIDMNDVERRVRLSRGEPETAAEGSGTSEGTRAPDGDDSSGDDETGGQNDGPEKFSDEWFEKATIAELKPELQERELPVTGKRDELADRLYENLVDEGVITPEEDDEDE